MKLLFVTMEGCAACIHKREMVFDELPTVFPGIEIEELDLNEWDKITQMAGTELLHSDRAPGFVMLDDSGKAMFQVIGSPGAQYLERLVKQYQMISGFASVEVDSEETQQPILSVECVKGRCLL